MSVFQGIAFLMMCCAVECLLFDKLFEDHDGFTSEESLQQLPPLGKSIKSIRNIFMERLQLKDDIHAPVLTGSQTPSLDSLVKSVVVTSDGTSETGEVTMTVSFLRTNGFAWAIKRYSILSKGQWTLQGNTITTAVTLKEDDFRKTELIILVGTDIVVIEPTERIKNAGEERLAEFTYLVRAPEKVSAENGTVSFDVHFLSNASSQIQSGKICFYLSLSIQRSRPILEYNKLRLDYYATNATITFEVIPELHPVVLALGMELRNRQTVEETNLFKIKLLKPVEIEDHSYNTMDGVSIINPRRDRSTVYYNGDQLYGGIPCVALGYTAPSITFSKDGQPVKQVSFFNNDFIAFAYVSLDGSETNDAKGTYICEVKSGNEVTQKQITVEELIDPYFSETKLVWNTTGTIEVTCTATGNPRPTIRMFINTKPGYWIQLYNVSTSNTNIQVYTSEVVMNNHTTSNTVLMEGIQGNNIPSVSCVITNNDKEEVIEVNNNPTAPLPTFYVDNSWPKNTYFVGA